MRNITRKLAVLAIPFAIGGTLLTACGEKPEPKVANVKPGEMPQGASWNGVYFNPVFGHLHMVEAGGSVQGRWKKTDESAWGELTGEINGNLVKYEWTEHKAGMVGTNAASKGKGYFLYKRPEGADVDDTLEGEYGLNDKEFGSKWDCVKQRRVTPDLKSIGGSQESGGPSKDWK
ncbi:MAG: hypothetical protein ABW133_21325 [Polyangiaceae bacterium]